MHDFLPKTPDLNSILDRLERTELDRSIPSMSTPLWGELEGIPFLHVRGLASYWQRADLPGYSRSMEDVIAGLNGQGEDFYFLLYGRKNQLWIYIGAGTRSSQPDLSGTLAGAFPGIRLDPEADTQLGRKLDNDGFFRWRGRLAGVPALIGQNENDGLSQSSSNPGNGVQHHVSAFTAPSSLERLIRGLQGSSWGFFLHAIPQPLNSLQRNLAELLKTMSVVQTQTRLQVQKLSQQMTKVSEETQEGSTTSLSAEQANRQAEYVLSRLELQLKRLRRARAEGGWMVDTHFFSPDQSTLLRMQTLLRSVFHTGDDAPEPLRSFVSLSNGSARPEVFSTLLSTDEVARLAYLPREEAPGYQIRDFTLFDVDQKIGEEEDVVTLGTILEYGRDTALPYSIPLETLSQHTLICGVTGSGKTTTILNLLTCLNHHNPRIPFLVIEPTKSEYRSLLGQPIGQGTVPDLKIYTLGDETTCPLRLNPFQFEIMDREHFTHPQTHIDYLKSVFSAAFVLYPPMPYVLEICLNEIYTDRGWNLTTNRNDRLPEKYWNDAQKWPIFPSFEDLFLKIDEVTERLGYDNQIKMDVKAGLQTRIQSMMVGGKGLMLNTPLDKGIGSLLESPCLLELERIGDDEQKVFLMGILMTRLFEFRRLQNEKQGGGMLFQHLTVIEEAHRLLRATPPQAVPDQSNSRGQAVETFSNLLSEIRAYGEGILIAEQIPAKLTIDALKNTNLKIMHRLVAEDDRHALQAMTNMDEAQSRYLVVMPRGQAAVFNQGDDHPLLIHIKPENGVLQKARPRDEEIRWPQSDSIDDNEINALLKFVQNTGTKEQSKLLAKQVTHDAEFRTLWCAGHLRLWLPSLCSSRMMESVQRHIQRSLGGSPDLLTAVLARAVQSLSWFDSYNRGRMYAWNYEVIRAFHEERLHIVALLISGQADMFSDSAHSLYQTTRQRVKMPNGPFVGCYACHECCLYRYDLAPLVNDSALLQEWELCLRSGQTNEEFCTQWMDANRHALQTYLDDDNLPDSPELLICLSAQGIARLGLSSASQRRMMDRLCEYL